MIRCINFLARKERPRRKGPRNERNICRPACWRGKRRGSKISLATYDLIEPSGALQCTPAALLAPVVAPRIRKRRVVELAPLVAIDTFLEAHPILPMAPTHSVAKRRRGAHAPSNSGRILVRRGHGHNRWCSECALPTRVVRSPLFHLRRRVRRRRRPESLHSVAD